MTARRVLHVIPAIAPRYGGPSVAVVGMCRALCEAGVSVTVATTDADGPGRLSVPLESEQTYSGLPCIFFRRRISESFKWSRPMGQWLQHHVGDFDVVHVHAVFSHSSIAAGRACVEHGIPYIVRPLGTLDPWSVNRKRLRKRVLFRLGVEDLLRGAAALHYTSRDEMRLAESVVPGLPDGVVIPLGIDEAMFATDRSERDAAPPYILALSRLEEKKGLDVLIAAFHRLAVEPRFDGWRLVIAGDGAAACVASLKSLAAAGPGASRIEFSGWVSGDVKLTLLRRAALFAAPSHQENFGISLVEALACGVPALVTPGVNLAGDIQEAGAGWVSQANEASLSETIRSAISDPADLEARGRSARVFAGAFHWPAVAERLRDLYDRVCAAPPEASSPAVVGRRASH